jgi:hypothetical protein
VGEGKIEVNWAFVALCTLIVAAVITLIRPEAWLLLERSIVTIIDHLKGVVPI